MSEMTDRELLELAAKAVGIDGGYFESANPIFTGIYCSIRGAYWNPLTDDGEAFRLLVKLRIDLFNYDADQTDDEDVSVDAVHYRGADRGIANELLVGGANAATRRAIVRVAAEIGKSL